MYIVVVEQLIEGVELPVRDGIVKLQDSAELRRRVGDGYSHDGTVAVVVSSRIGAHGRSPLPVFYIAEANWQRAGSGSYSSSGPVNSCASQTPPCTSSEPIPEARALNSYMDFGAVRCMTDSDAECMMFY